MNLMVVRFLLLAQASGGLPEPLSILTGARNDKRW